MKPNRPRRRRWRIVRRLVLVVLVGLIAFWGTFNLFFSASWGADLIAGRIEKRLGLPCDLESVTWTPWGGVMVRDFVVKPGDDSGILEEILRVDTVRVDLSWVSLVQSKKRFERLEISGVTGEISIELLKVLVKKNLVSETQQRGSEENTLGDSPNTSPSGTTPQKENKEGEVISKKGEPRESPDFQASPVDDFEGVIVFEDVNLALTSLEHPALSIAVEDLEGELPVWGAEREGHVGFAALHAGGEMVNGEEIIPVKWKGQFIRIDEHELKVIGLNFNMNFAIRISQGLPIGLRVVAPNQDVDFPPIFGEEKSPVGIKHFSFRGGIQGYLMMPQSFSGYGNAGFEGMEIYDDRDASVIEFYRGYGEARVNRAGLVIPDARMIGDEEAILLNGFVTSDGEAAATVRVVGSPERAEVYEQRVHRANEEWTLDFEPLVTEDRLYRDLRMESSEEGMIVNLGEKRTSALLFPALKAILTGKHPSANLLQ
ncbi:MAG: hypothetical protein L7T84_06375 [Akkermansiaceae bacterium]|nr:hypothetical protein [Akkermansiaceae bacterium]